MQSYAWLASVFGPYLLILGVWGVFYYDHMTKVFSSIRSTPGVLYVLGSFNLWLGLVLVNSYNMWVMNWTFLVTLLGWVLLLHGAASLFFPQRVFQNKARGAKKMSIRAVVSLVWGLALCLLAFGTS